MPLHGDRGPRTRAADWRWVGGYFYASWGCEDGIGAAFAGGVSLVFDGYAGVGGGRFGVVGGREKGVACGEVC